MFDPEYIKYLTEKHILRYSNMLTSTSDYVNKQEALGYLNIWIYIKSKNYIWVLLHKTAQMEVMDAHEDEDLE